jgi:drug/metabolite transporter (DMT)-like permease
VSEPDETPPTPPRSGHVARAAPSLVGLVLAFAAIYVIWGSTYLAIRIGVRSFPPFLMAGCRFLLAGGILYGALRLSGAAAPTRAHWRNAAVSGLLMLTMGNGLVTWAEESVPSNLAALLVAAVPLYMVLLDWWRPGGVRPPRPVLIGVAIGFAGMVLLVMPHRAAAPQSSASAAGIAALMVAALGWSAGSLWAKYTAHHTHTGIASAQQMLAGGAALLAIGLGRGEGARVVHGAIAWPSVLAFLYLVVFGSLVAFSAFGWLVVVTTPARLSTAAYVNPVIAVILGWVLLGESLGQGQLAGAGLIVAAVVVMTVGGGARRAAGTRRRTPAPGPAHPDERGIDASGAGG